MRELPFRAMNMADMSRVSSDTFGLRLLEGQQGRWLIAMPSHILSHLEAGECSSTKCFGQTWNQRLMYLTIIHNSPQCLLCSQLATDRNTTNEGIRPKPHRALCDSTTTLIKWGLKRMELNASCFFPRTSKCACTSQYSTKCIVKGKH